MPNHPRKLVMIAAGDQAVRESLQFALRLEGFCVRTHAQAAELLASPELGRASCVIIDDHRPRIDGQSLLRRLHGQNPQARAILLTSHVNPAQRARADSDGFNAVLEKPLLNNVLLHTIQTVLGGQLVA